MMNRQEITVLDAENAQVLARIRGLQ